MRFSVVQATYNRLKYIKVTLPFLLSQNFDPEQYEIIVVDYGVTDGLKEFIEDTALTITTPSIKYIPTRRIDEHEWYRSIPVNIGIKQACGDIILTVDSDCIYPVDTLNKYNNEYNKSIKQMVHGMRRIEIPESLTMRILHGELSLLTNLEELKKVCLPGIYVYMGAMQSFPRDVAIEIGGMDERAYGWGHEDQEFMMRVERAGFKPIGINDICVFHLWHKMQECIPDINYNIAAHTQHNLDYRCANIDKEWGVINEDIVR